MNEKCCTCGQDIKPLEGCYITPNGTFCVPCYDTKENKMCTQVFKFD